jgi:hypothetical protein
MLKVVFEGDDVTMLETDLRAIGRAVLAAVVLAGGCSFKDKGIDTTNVLEADADIVGGSIGGTGGGTGGATLPGTGGSRLDGAVVMADGPAPLPVDAAIPPDLGPDVPAQSLGAACNGDGACTSGFCVDGVCCDQRCGAPCFSCSGMTNGAAPGLCKPDVANTACGAASCMGSTHTPAPRCDGNGMCMPRPAAACPNSLTCASATACRSKCAADNECTGGMVCDQASGTCRSPGKPNGQACTTGSDCNSGNCADKVCCDLACTGVCRACVMAQTGKPDGTCADVLAGTKDMRCGPQAGNPCGPDGVCEAGARCRMPPNGTRCATECCSGNGGPGGGARVCAYECNNGTCDRTRPNVIDRCGGAQCCCPNGAGSGTAACTFQFGCQGGGCVQ